MENFTLNNGVQIPAAGLGVFRLTDEQQAVNTVRSAIAAGYRHIDTAAVYKNESAVGAAVKECGIDRKELFITTKLWNDAQRTEQIREALELSLSRLQMDYVDLYLIHWPVPGHFAHTWREMEKLYSEGKVRAIGVSNFRICDLEVLRKTFSIVPAVNQVELTPYFQQEELLEYCREHGIRLEAWGTFTAGQTDLLNEPVLKEIADSMKKTTGQIVLRWNLQRGVIPLTKSSNAKRQKDNLSIFDFELDAASMAKIAAMDCGRRIGRDPADSDF